MSTSRFTESKDFVFSDLGGPPKKGHLVRLVPNDPDKTHPADDSRAQVRHLICNEWEWAKQLCPPGAIRPEVEIDCNGNINLVFLKELGEGEYSLVYQRYNKIGEEFGSTGTVLAQPVENGPISIATDCRHSTSGQANVCISFSAKNEVQFLGGSGEEDLYLQIPICDGVEI